MDSTLPPRQELQAIHSLMARATTYPHISWLAAMVAGALALLGAFATHRVLETTPLENALIPCGTIWGLVFAGALGTQLVLSYRSARRAGDVFWGSLAREIAQVLWPPLLGAGVLTIAVVERRAPDLIPIVWVLCYGIGAVEAGAYSRPAVRNMGILFLLSGVVGLLWPLSPPVLLGATFGLFHLGYGCALRARSGTN